MKYIPFIIGTLSALLLSLIGIAIKYHKAYWLISGYNTMSKEKKENVESVPNCCNNNLMKFMSIT